MRYLGIDFGTKNLGIAISDEAGSFAFPREVLVHDARIFDTLAKMAARENVGAIIIGDTLTLNGGPNDITAAAEEFSKKIGTQLALPVHRIREAWSTQEAARFAPQGKKHNDASSAAILLQRFLDAQPRSEI